MVAGVYIHIPFCKSRCSYCDFATDVWRSDEAVERYINALCMEISVSSPHVSKGSIKNSNSWDSQSTLPNGPLPLRDALAEPAGRVSVCVDTLYLGGGTPSLLKPEQVQKILNAVNLKFEISNDAEITMEMNPATVTRESLASYRSLGVNRASFGVQTFNDRHLKLLARGHDANDARQTFKMLRDARFDNISFDLIAGLPGQTLDDWKRNLDEAVTMEPEHLSLYLLEIHEGTPLAEQLRSGRRPIPDEESAAEMYETMIERMEAADYEQYEISNFAKAGFESCHNIKYWRMDPVFGFGVSAHSFDGIQRFANERDTARYVESIETVGNAEVFRETIDIPSETAFLGLRLNQGIDMADYYENFGVDLRTKLTLLSEDGLVEISGSSIKLTRRGRLYSNEVFAEFV